MPRTELERAVQPSLLDRLTDLDPAVPADPPTTREATARAFRASVRRDVEWLLNSRRTIVPAPDACPELRRSVYEFGLVDTTSISADHGGEVLLDLLRDTLARFEPRLANVVVRAADGEGPAGTRPMHLRCVVEGTLLMDPSPEQVVFDTVLEVASGTYAVEDGVSDSAG